jgi:hypothetical protein
MSPQQIQFYEISTLPTFGGDSTVDIATGYGLGRSRSRSSSPARGKMFSTSSRPVLGPTQPLTQCVPGAPSPAVKRPEREAD